VNQGEAFEHLCSLDKRILCRTQQGQQLIERLRAAASTELQLVIERMLAVAAHR
jgi:hypothetical protein